MRSLWRRPAAMLVLPALLLLAVALPARAAAASFVTLDGEFDDWVDQVRLDDPRSGPHSEDLYGEDQEITFHCDIRYFYIAHNIDEEAFYFMVERWPKNAGDSLQPVNYIVYFSLDGDSDYNPDHPHPAPHLTDQDYLVNCYYNPKVHPNTVVTVRRGDAPDTPLTLPDGSTSYSGDWGEPTNLPGREQGGLRVEFYVPFSYINVALHQRLNLFLRSTMDDAGSANPHDDFCPNNGPIDWDPVPTLGMTGSILLVLAGLTLGYLALRMKLGSRVALGGRRAVSGK